jgi:hypothetical protein
MVPFQTSPRNRRKSDNLNTPRRAADFARISSPLISAKEAPDKAEDLQSSVPDGVRVILKLLVDTFTALEVQIVALDAEINQRSKSDPRARRLMTNRAWGQLPRRQSLG